MAELKGVSQFVKGFLDDPLVVDHGPAKGAKAFFESICRNDACLSPQLRFPIHIGQDRNKKVHPGDTENLQSVGWSFAGKHLKYRSREVLSSLIIQGKFQVLQKWNDCGSTSEYPADFLFELFQEFLVKISNGRDDDAIFWQGAQTGLWIL
jgi:hypothetical protein